MIWGPRIHSSPSLPTGSSSAEVPLTSTIFTSVLGTMQPAEPGLNGAAWSGVRGRPRLGHAGARHHRAVELGAERARHLLAEGGRAGEHEAHAREVELGHR